MSEEHQQWLDQAVAQARAKEYDKARELALRVLREDGRNPQALWVVASVTNSLPERRNALNALLRIQPENVHARRMLSAMNQPAPKASQPLTTVTEPSVGASTTIRALNTPTQPVFLYAVVASLVLIVIATIFAGIIF